MPTTPTEITMTATATRTVPLTIDAIVAALRATPRAAQWQVTETRRARHERYVTFLRCESEREVQATRWEVWLGLAAAGDRQGEASFTLGAGDAADALQARLREALAAAESAPNPAWTLPGVGEPGAAEQPADPAALADRRLAADPEAALAGLIRDYAAAAASAPWVRPSTLELFATVEDRRLVGSRGLDLRERQTSLYAEFVLLHRPAAGDEVEFFDRRESATVEGLDLARRVGEAAACVRDGAAAAATPAGTMPVVIADDYLAEMLEYYAYHADAGVHARGIAAFALDGAVLSRSGGDALTLASDPTVPSLAAYAFDANGYAPQRQELVTADRLVGVCGEGRWMQRLGRAPRGKSGTLIAPAGRTGIAELLRGGDPGVLEVVRFSEFRPREDTGAFSGEIRLAYLHRPDGTRVPVKGGSVTGTLGEALADARFSAETATARGFHGPRAVRLERCTVTA
jgi:predicted Zn-dependent protease